MLLPPVMGYMCPEEAKRIMGQLRDESGFLQLDEEWTVMKRERDHASLSYGPVPEPGHPKTNW